MTFNPQRSNWLRAILKTERLTHIVDVGANPIDPAPYGDLLAAKACQLTGFEPQQDAFARLQRTKGDLETYHNCAVGTGDVKTLNIMGHHSMTSFFEGDFESVWYLRRYLKDLQLKEKISLQTKALDDLSLGTFDLLKIDIQGGEIDVFEGARAGLKSAIAVIPEVRFYQLYLDEPMSAGVDTYLRAQGYALHKYMFTKGLILPTSQYERMNPDAFQNQLIDGDAVYIRDLKRPDDYSNEDLKHLAILSDGVWFSFDLTVRALDLLVKRGQLDAVIPAAYVDRLPQEFLKSGG